MSASLTFTGQPWAPASYTLPLQEPMVTDGPAVVDFIEHKYRQPDGELIVLDEWQRCLFAHVLERYPDDWHDTGLRGRLRYRQVVISMGRQNGKSVIGSTFAIYGLLLHTKAPSVVGTAKSVEQANTVYSRVEYAVRNDALLLHHLKPSGTRGIKRRNGSGSYVLKPSLDEGLQSVPVTLVIADELHLTKPSMWDSVVTGQRAQPDALILGITTAGDSTSRLLKRLYQQGEEAIANPGSDRFGFFLWEAPDGSNITTPGAVEAANPAIACGRIDLGTVISDVRKQPEPDIQRYTLNRFINASNTWIPANVWAERAGEVPDGQDYVFAVTKTPNWTSATITATFKDESGHLFTEVAASVVRPTRDRLIELCEDLAERHTATFVVEAAALSTVGKALKERGYSVWMLTHIEMCQASGITWSAITNKTMTHAGDPLLTDQIPHAVRINSGETWRVSNRGEHDSDAVLSTVMGLHVANAAEKPMQLF
jgi:hypothetical protein